MDEALVSAIKDALQRAGRTFLQVFLGTFLAMIVIPGETVPDADAVMRALYAALFAAFIAALTFLHNLLEDSGAVPPLLKSPTPTASDLKRERPKPPGS